MTNTTQTKNKKQKQKPNRILLYLVRYKLTKSSTKAVNGRNDDGEKNAIIVIRYLVIQSGLPSRFVDGASGLDDGDEHQGGYAPDNDP